MKPTITNQENGFKNRMKIWGIIILVTFIIKTKAQCTAHFTAVTDPQNNGVVYFQDSSTYTGQYMHFTWDLGNGVSQTGQTVSQTYSMAGTYYVCLSISDSVDISCAGTFCDSVSVLVTNATCSAYFNSVDSLGSTYFSGSVAGYATNYFWDFGDGTTSTLLNPLHSFSSGGNHIVCFTASNPSSACNFTHCDTIFTSSCNAAITFTHDSTGNGITFSSNTTGTSDTYAWTFGDGSTSSFANPYHVYANNGTYTVCLTVSSGTDTTCWFSICTTVSLSGLCNADFDIIQDSVNINHYWVLNYSGNSNSAFLWNFGDGDTSILQYPSHTYSGTGSYNLCVTVSDNNGCSDTHCEWLYVLRSPNPVTITVIDPLTLGINEQAVLKTNLENYPNPFNGNTTINYSVSNAAKVELTVYDLLGNKIASIENSNKPAGNYSVIWNADNIPEGLYLLQLKANNQVSTKKIIVAK